MMQDRKRIGGRSTGESRIGGYRTRRTQDRKDAGQEDSEEEDTGLGGCRTGRMQGMRM